jgi:uncharacterized protein YjbI with pentapeptide repeats
MSVKTIEPIKAEKNPPTTKPGVSHPATKMTMALITNRNKPKVSKVSGRVRTINKGLMMALTSPRTIEAIAALTMLATKKPGTIYAVIIRAKAEINQVSKNSGIYFFPFNLDLKLCKLKSSIPTSIVEIFYMWRQITSFILILVFFFGAMPAQAMDYPPPLSFSNAELKGRDFSGQTLRAAEFSNANMELANFSDADLRGAVFSASVMTGANLHGADLSNAMVDQVNLTKADLGDAVLTEALLLRAIFDDVSIANADFTDAILDRAQIKELCAKASGTNPKTGIETRYSLGCR